MRAKDYQKGIDILNKWLVRNPNDKNASSQIEQLKNLIEKAQSDTAILDSTVTDSVQN